jgi:3-hydroxyisobutyrate dehydrogenase
VGVIGLGKMGSAMAARLLAAGHVVSGHDLNPEAVAVLATQGGKAAASPAHAAQHAAVLLVMVHDAAQVESVLFGGQDAAQGAAGQMAPGSVVWLASTVAPDYARALAQRLQAQGVALVDGPVSGGATGAEDGDLVAICGATPQALEQATFALQACCRQVHHVGEPGMGSTVKMINQLLVATHCALTSEAMALAMRAGVDPARLIEVIAQSAGTSRIFEKRAPRIAQGDHAVHVTINTLRKDLQIAIDTAHSLGLEPVIARSAHGLLSAAATAGCGAQSDTTLVQDYLGTRPRAGG